MYIDWVITLSVIIVFLTCAFLAYGLRYCIRKVYQEAEKEVNQR